MKKALIALAIVATGLAACQRTSPSITAEPGVHAGVDNENRIGGHPNEGLAVDTGIGTYDHQIKAPEVAKEEPKPAEAPAAEPTDTTKHK